MSTEYLSMPGFLPLRQAAEQLGISDKRVLRLIQCERLPAKLVQGRWIVPICALANFQRQPHGRIRQRPVLWRRYATSTVYLRRVEAPILAGCEQSLQSRIAAMAGAGEHTFPGTMQRYIWTAESLLSVVLIWKSTEASEEAIERDMAAFKALLADMVDWQAARDETSEVVAHT